jgi:tetratricopeptide (TPR) repeat protein
MKKYAAAIKELRQGLKHGTVSYYDDSRVWSTGTDVERVLQDAIKSRDGLAKEGRLSNLQGMQWASIGRYNEALKSLKEAADASEQALGADNLSYATCVNNMGACLEAMGR